MNDELLIMADALYELGSARLAVDDERLRQLTQPDRYIEVPVTLSDGKSATLWRVQHDRTRGPAKGGLRIAPDANRHEVEALAKKGSNSRCLEKPARTSMSSHETCDHNDD